MKERPILFSGAMVRAILEGRKTQTRHVMKPQPDDDGKVTVGQIGTSRGSAYVGNGSSGGIVTRVPCPYGQPGDQVWVREAFDPIYPQDKDYNGGAPIEIDYRADQGAAYQHRMKDVLHTRRWKPSIHMPRWASRITLEITAVRVERLQEIDERDAQAEGADPTGVNATIGTEHIAGFWLLWDSINASRGFSWATNPWIWVIEFRPVSRETQS